MGDGLSAVGGGPGFDQAAEHFADDDRSLFQTLENFLRQIVDSAGDLDLGPQFRQGAFGHIKETDGVFVRVALIAFGDIAWHTDGRPSELIAQAKIRAERPGLADLVNLNRQIPGLLPHQKLFKPLSHSSSLTKK